MKKRTNHINYRLYVVTHGESSTVQNLSNDYGQTGEDNKPNILTIEQLKIMSGFNGNLTIYRAAQPGAVFMSSDESNDDLRDNYVGTEYFPNFARRIMPRRNVNNTKVARDVEGESGDNIVSSSEHVLVDTLQKFTGQDEIYNERLLTDLGFEEDDVIKHTDVNEASGEFGVWLRVSGGEDEIGVWPQNKKQGEPGEFYKIVSNDDNMFMDSFGRPKEIRIHEFLQNIVRMLKTTGRNKELIVKNSRAKNSSKHNRKWPVINTDIDNIEIFFANCSPAEMHETRMRLLEDKRIRLRKDNCGDLIKWFNLFCLACKRIQIFQNGKANMRVEFNNFSHVFTRNDEDTMTELEPTETPWSIIDKEERAELYKNFICFLTNYNNWIQALPQYRDIIINNLAFLINNITTPLNLGGTGQLTDRGVDVHDGSRQSYDTVTQFVLDNLNRYMLPNNDRDTYEFLVNSIWDGGTISDYELMDYHELDTTISPDISPQSSKRCPGGICNKIRSYLGYGGKKIMKKNKKCTTRKLKQKMICHKGTKKQLKKLNKRTKKLNLSLTECAKKRLKKWNKTKKIQSLKK
jgi:hypothetical protein